LIENQSVIPKLWKPIVYMHWKPTSCKGLIFNQLQSFDFQSVAFEWFGSSWPAFFWRL